MSEGKELKETKLEQCLRDLYEALTKYFEEKPETNENATVASNHRCYETLGDALAAIDAGVDEL